MHAWRSSHEFERATCLRVCWSRSIDQRDHALLVRDCHPVLTPSIRAEAQHERRNVRVAVPAHVRVDIFVACELFQYCARRDCRWKRGTRVSHGPGGAPELPGSPLCGVICRHMMDESSERDRAAAMRGCESRRSTGSLRCADPDVELVGVDGSGPAVLRAAMKVWPCSMAGLVFRASLRPPLGGSSASRRR